MEYTIDLTTRPEGYREALIRFLDSKHVKRAGIWLEYGHPRMDDNLSMVIRYHRLKTIDDRRVCARVETQVLFENTWTIWVEPCGLFGEIAEKLLDEMIPSARMTINNEGTVSEILGFDLINYLDHKSYQD